MKKHSKLHVVLAVLLALVFVTEAPLSARAAVLETESGVAYMKVSKNSRAYRKRVFKDVLRNHNQYWAYYDLNQLEFFEGSRQGKAYRAHPDSKATIRYVCGLLYWGYGDQIYPTNSTTTNTGYYDGYYRRRGGGKWDRAVTWAHDLGIITDSQYRRPNYVPEKIEIGEIVEKLGVVINGRDYDWRDMNHRYKKARRYMAVHVIWEFTQLPGYDPTNLQRGDTPNNSSYYNY